MNELKYGVDYEVINDHEEDVEFDDISYITICFKDGEKQIYGPGDQFDQVVDLDFISSLSDRIWDCPNQHIRGYLLPNFNPEEYTDYDDKYTELVNKLLVDGILSIYEADGKNRRFNCQGAFEFEINGELIADNGEWDGTCLPDVSTTDKLIECIKKVMYTCQDIINFNEINCRVNGKFHGDYKKAVLSSIPFCEMLFYSDRGDLLAVTAINDNNGLFTGEYKITYQKISKNFEITDGTLCRYLGNEKNVIIPEKVEEIDAQAFQDCDMVERITIPDGVDCYMNAYAFELCTTVNKIYFGNRVKMSEDVQSLFRGCESLECVEVSPENSYYSSRDGILYNKDGSELLYDPKNPDWSDWETQDEAEFDV